VIPPEGRTILERRLKRATGLICARTDIAYLEPPERRRRIQQTKERERQKKEQERLAKFTNQQKAQQQPTQMIPSGGKKVRKNKLLKCPIWLNQPNNIPEHSTEFLQYSNR
jgi:hypothetical protein